MKTGVYFWIQQPQNREGGRPLAPKAPLCPGLTPPPSVCLKPLGNLRDSFGGSFVLFERFLRRTKESGQMMGGEFRLLVALYT